MTETSSKLLYSATMSLDGFIAGVDGDMHGPSFVLTHEPPRRGYDPQVTFLDDLAAAAETPVLLGDGTRLFEHRGGTNIRLERLPRQSGLTSLWFRVVK